MIRGLALRMMKGWAAPELEPVFARARELCHELDDPPEVFPVRWALTLFHAIRGDLRVYRERADELMIQAEQSGNPAYLMAAHHLVGVSREFLGDMVESSQVLDRGRELHVPAEHMTYTAMFGLDPGHDCPRDVEPAAVGAGLSRSRRRSARAKRWRSRRSQRQPMTLAFALVVAQGIHLYRGEAAEAISLGDEIVALSREYELEAGNRMGPLVPGRGARRCSAAPPKGIDQLKDSLAVQQAIGSGLVRTAFLALLAEMLAGAGRIDEGLRAVDEGFAHAEKTLEGGYLAELHRCAANCCAWTGTPRRRKTSLRQAIAACRRSSRRSPSSCAPRPAWRGCSLATGERDDGARRARAGLRVVHRRAHDEGSRSPRATTARRDRIVTRDEAAVPAGRARDRGGVRVPARDPATVQPAPPARRTMPSATRRPAIPRSACRAAACAAPASASACCRGCRAPAFSTSSTICPPCPAAATSAAGSRRGGSTRTRRGDADPCRRSSRREASSPSHSTRLRASSSSSTREPGALSADVWTLGGTMLRNLLVNWMVLIPAHRRRRDAAAPLPRAARPALAAGARQPRDARLVVRPRLDPDRHPDRHRARPTPRCSCRASGIAPAGSRSFVVWFLDAGAARAVPAVGPPLLGVAIRRRRVARDRAAGLGRGHGAAVDRRRRVQQALVAAVDLDRGRPLPDSSAAWSASWAHHFLTALAQHDPQVFVVVDLPTSLALLFLQITVFIGLASRDMSDDDREWWARAGAWILIVGLSWLVGERGRDPRPARARRRPRRARALAPRRPRRDWASSRWCRAAPPTG